MTLAATGPAAIVAFGLNGVIAFLTALSFAEMASKFPESGGTYTFAKKVLSIEAAFTVGWVVWFASIVAAVLYAAGFAYFLLVMISDLWRAAFGSAPSWLNSPSTVTAVAITVTLILAARLAFCAAGGGPWVNVGKVIVFAILIVAGLWATARQPMPDTMSKLQPFFTSGFGGLIQAMGYSFIALQGFDLIAAVGGEVRQPAKTLPRAMFLSLAIALIIYLPLLFVISTVGTPEGQNISAAAAADPEGIVAVAAQRYLGPFGYWLVIAAAILSMFSALHANLYAASRIPQAMARDRTLPAPLGRIHARRGTPAVAVAVTALLVSSILFVLSDLSAAGAAASLIFLMTFAMAHWVAILVRQRSVRLPPPFRAPLFPAFHVLGGAACLGLAIFQGFAVPKAGAITLTWLSIGGILFLTLLAHRARLWDASSTALDPELVTLRGHTPLVLVPVANPLSAEPMITLADALVPAHVGRVLAQTVVAVPPDWNPQDDPGPIDKSQQVMRALLQASVRTGIRIELLTTVAPHPMEEIARVARLHRCESVLLGLSEISADQQGGHLETLLSTLDANVVVLPATPELAARSAQKILIPVARRGGHEHLLAQLLGSLLRGGQREVTFLRVLSTAAGPDEVRRAERDLARLAADETRQPFHVDVVQSDDVLAAMVEARSSVIY